MKSLRFITVILVLALSLSLFAPFAFAKEEPELTSSQCVIIGETESGDVLYEMAADTKRAPASLTKMMTILLAVEAVESGKVSLSDMVRASESCRSDLTDDSSNAQIFSGEIMSLKDLLYCAALASANEACNIIAEYIGGSRSEFVLLMNARAKELGCRGTHFANTHGLPDDEHYSTARDLYLIACEGMRHELFRALVGTAQYTTSATNACGERTLSNSNALLTPKSVYGKDFVYKGAVGIKTGHTNAAGFCLASCAERNGVSFTAVVLGAKGDLVNGDYFENFTDSRTLFDWAFSQYVPVSLISEGDSLGKHEISYNNRRGTVELIAGESIKLWLPEDIDLSAIEKDMDINIDSLIPAGHEIGTLTLKNANGRVYGTVPVISGETVLESPAPASPDIGGEKIIEDNSKPIEESGILSVWQSMDSAHRLALCLMLAVIIVFISVIIIAARRKARRR